MKSRIVIIGVFSIILFVPYVIMYIGRTFNFSDGEYGGAVLSYFAFLIGVVVLAVDKQNKP